MFWKVLDLLKRRAKIRCSGSKNLIVMKFRLNFLLFFCRGWDFEGSDASPQLSEKLRQLKTELNDLDKQECVLDSHLKWMRQVHV